MTIMLLAQAIELLRTEIEALSWVDRFGGLVQVVNYETFDNSNNRVVKTIPISCISNTDDCINQSQFYQNLIPDSSKTSILYFEPVQGFTDNGAINGNQYFRNYTGRTRLVGWVNSKKLGLENDCLLSAKLIRSMLSVLVSEYSNLTGVFQGANIRFRNPRVAVKSPSIFNSYTYDVDTQFLINPYDYFAIDVDVVMDLNVGCIYDVGEANSAYWLGDVISGSVPASYLGDETGTFTGVQKYGDLNCEFTPESSNITFVVKSIDRNSLELVLGTFTGSFGDVLNDSSKWVTTYNIYDYIAPNIVGDGELFSFAKLDFAQDNGFTNLASLQIFVEIRRGLPVTEPVDPISNLSIFREDLAGTFISPQYLAETTDDRLLIGCNSPIDTVVEANFERLYTGRNAGALVNQIIGMVVDEDGVTPVIYVSLQDRTIRRVPVSSLDANDLYDFTTADIIYTASTGAPRFGKLDERLNGEQVLWISGTPTEDMRVLYYDGANWVTSIIQSPSPDFFRWAGDFEVIGNKIYCLSVSSLADYSFYIVTYTGDFLVSTNWTFNRIITNDIDAVSNGDGTTANIFGARFMTLDTVNTVNGEPRVFLTFPTKHIVFEVLANTTGAINPNEWDFTQIIGEEGTDGNNQGTGLAARITTPNKPIIKDNVMYLACGLPAHTVITVDVDPTSPTYLKTDDYKGQFGISGTTNYIEF